MPRPRRSTEDDREHIKWYKIDNISLDLSNPRLLVPPKARELDIVQLMYENEALDELALSFLENGYFMEEPLVLVPRDGAKGRYTVVEGNRRVATLKLLLDDRLREAIGVSDWPKLTAAEREGLSEVPAVLYNDRDEVIPYLGFRHISGIKTWEPFQKSRYVAALVNSGRSVKEIERSVGDRTNAVRKLYRSFVAYTQITQDLEIPARLLEKSFSLLEVALSQSAIKTFLALPSKLPTGPTQSVIPEDRYEELRELVSWIFGDPSRRQERIITDSRQIPQRLAPVVADPDALGYLRKTRDLEGAYEFSGGERNVLLRHIATIRRAVQRALGLLPSYGSDEEVTEALRSLRPLVGSLLEDLPE